MRIYVIFFIAALTVVAGCESSQRFAEQPLNLPGTSKVEGSDALARDIVNEIFTVDQGEDPACDRRALADVRIVEDFKGGVSWTNSAGVLVTGEWEELWTIDRCGSIIPYSIFFKDDKTADGVYWAVGTRS